MLVEIALWPLAAPIELIPCDWADGNTDFLYEAGKDCLCPLSSGQWLQPGL